MSSIKSSNESDRARNLRCSAISAANSRPSPDVSLFDWSLRGWSRNAPDINPSLADYRVAGRKDLFAPATKEAWDDAKAFDAAFRKHWCERVNHAMAQAFSSDWFADAHKAAV